MMTWLCSFFDLGEKLHGFIRRGSPWFVILLLPACSLDASTYSERAPPLFSIRHPACSAVLVFQPMAYESVPMRTLRLAALFMSFAFGVIGGSVGLNALIKCVRYIVMRLMSLPNILLNS